MDVIFLDFAKAIDKVPHEKNGGLWDWGEVLAWVREWLKDRKQRVESGGCWSEWCSVVSVIRYISVSISIPLLAMYFNSVSIIVLQCICISVSISIRQVFQFQFCFTSISVFISVIEFFVFILCGIKKQISKLM